MQKSSINPPFLFLFIAALFAISTVFAENSISNLTNFQVIQRTSETFADIPVFGYHDFSVGSHIQARICQQINNEVLRNFDWEIVDTSFSSMTWKGVIHHVPVGGEYSVQFSLLIFENQPAKPFATIEHILVGDIWGAGGQSNMLGEGDVSLSDKPIDQIHMITLDTGWQKAREPIGGVGCGPALRFALKVYAETSIPIGVAFYAVGGTLMSFWQKGTVGFNNWSSVLNSAGGNIKGIIWYQGEANVVNYLQDADIYKNQMKAFMSDTRTSLNNPGLPWILAQIATVCDNEGINPDFLMIVREAQRELPLEDQNATTITTADLPRQDCFHFATPQYQTIGNRFAAAALNKIYGRKDQPLGPRFSSAYFNDTANKTILILTKDISGEITVSDTPSDFFVINNGLKQNPISIVRKDISSILLTFNQQLSSNSTVGFGFGCDPTNLNCSDTSQIVLQPFYNQPIIDISKGKKQIDSSDSQSIRKTTSLENKIDITVKQNPFNLYALLLISFSEIKTNSAELSILNINGMTMRRIHLSIGQNCISLSKKFLPAGCYVLCIFDGQRNGTTKMILTGAHV